MNKMETTHKDWWQRLKSYMKSHTSLTIIISAVILLEVMMGVMFLSAQNFIQRTMVQNSPMIWGCGVAYAPGYYPQYDKFYMPYSVRRGQDSIISM